jgi:hypothetical protein
MYIFAIHAEQDTTFLTVYQPHAVLKMLIFMNLSLPAVPAHQTDEWWVTLHGAPTSDVNTTCSVVQDICLIKAKYWRASYLICDLVIKPDL